MRSFFFGHYWLFRLLSELFPLKKKVYFLIIFFFLPAVFWLSGIRVDGLLFFFLSVYLYYIAGRHNSNFKRWLFVAIGFSGIVICRPQVAVFTGLVTIGYYAQNKVGQTHSCLWNCLPHSDFIILSAGGEYFGENCCKTK